MYIFEEKTSKHFCGGVNLIKHCNTPMNVAVYLFLHKSFLILYFQIDVYICQKKLKAFVKLDITICAVILEVTGLSTILK